MIRSIRSHVAAAAMIAAAVALGGVAAAQAPEGTSTGGGESTTTSTTPAGTSPPATTPSSGTDVATTEVSTTVVDTVPTTDVPPTADDTDSPTLLVDNGATRSITFPVAGPVVYVNDFNACRDDCARYHRGSDLIGSKRQPIVAMVDGVVDHLIGGHPTAGFGITVRDAAGWSYSVYHLNNDSAGSDDGNGSWTFAAGLGAGSTVEAGQLIGWMGDSGNAEVSVPHAHVDISAPDGTPINPYWSLRLAQQDVTCSARLTDQAAERLPSPLPSLEGHTPDGWRTLVVGGEGRPSATFLIRRDAFVPVDTDALRVGDRRYDTPCGASVDLGGPGSSAGWSEMSTVECRAALFPTRIGTYEIVESDRWLLVDGGLVVAGVPSPEAPQRCSTLPSLIPPPGTVTVIVHQPIVNGEAPGLPAPIAANT